VPYLAELLVGRRVVVYNADFDRGILYNEIYRLAAGDDECFHTFDFWLRDMRWRCAMELYAAWWGDWSDYHKDYRWQRLPGGDHSALGDCRATLALLWRIAEDVKPSDGG
jgi:DNA polymerase-3 subunit epsilon